MPRRDILTGKAGRRRSWLSRCPAARRSLTRRRHGRSCFSRCRHGRSCEQGPAPGPLEFRDTRAAPLGYKTTAPAVLTRKMAARPALVFKMAGPVRLAHDPHASPRRRRVRPARPASCLKKQLRPVFAQPENLDRAVGTGAQRGRARAGLCSICQDTFGAGATRAMRAFFPSPGARKPRALRASFPSTPARF